MDHTQHSIYNPCCRRKSSLIRLAAGLIATIFCSENQLLVTWTSAFSINQWATRRPLQTSSNEFRFFRVNEIYSFHAEHETWESEEDDKNIPDESFEFIMEDCDKDEDTDKYQSLRLEWEQWSVAVEKALSALEKKRNSLKQEMVKAERLELLQRRAQLLQTYRHMFTDTSTATVQDWETGQDIVLMLDTATYGSIGEEIDALYAQSKKLKRGKLVVAALLDETSAAFGDLMKMKCDLDAVSVSEMGDGLSQPSMDKELFRHVQNRLVASLQYTNFVPPKDSDATTTSDKKRTGASDKSTRNKTPVIGSPASNIRKLTSPAGCTILVGRNRRGNEYLSLTVARGNDIWMHARNTPGAHVVIQQRRGGAVATDACWQRAADLAAFYSDARSERNVWVSAAEPKHLQKPRGAPLGAIKLREELRVLSGHPDDVPEECKEARAVSGQSEEYRIQDKAKLRKQNRQRQLSAKEKAKRKMEEKQKNQQEEQAGNFF